MCVCASLKINYCACEATIGVTADSNVENQKSVEIQSSLTDEVMRTSLTTISIAANAQAVIT